MGNACERSPSYGESSHSLSQNSLEGCVSTKQWKEVIPLKIVTVRQWSKTDISLLTFSQNCFHPLRFSRLRFTICKTRSIREWKCVRYKDLHTTTMRCIGDTIKSNHVIIFNRKWIRRLKKSFAKTSHKDVFTIKIFFELFGFIMDADAIKLNYFHYWQSET